MSSTLGRRLLAIGCVTLLSTMLWACQQTTPAASAKAAPAKTMPAAPMTGGGY